MRLSRWVRLSLCGALGVCLLSAVGLMRNPYGSLSSGVLTVEGEYYLYSPSSRAKIVEKLSLQDLPWYTGEKRVFRFQTQEEAGRYALKLLSERRAQVIFEETVAGVYSIYAYVRGGGVGVALRGAPVNLHLALFENCVQVGTPIIFGGY